MRSSLDTRPSAPIRMHDPAQKRSIRSKRTHAARRWMNPPRGEVWFVYFGEPIGREQAGVGPALSSSDDLMNEGSSGLVIVGPITRVPAGSPRTSIWTIRCAGSMP